jgi:hypothetical protein
MIYYQVYGLFFRSNYELPLDKIPEPSVIDYSVKFDDCANSFDIWRRDFDRPWYTSSWRVKCGRTTVEAWKTEDCGKFLFQFFDGVAFIIDRRCKDIWVDVRAATLQAAIRHLLFSLPGFLLGLRKYASLHGAAIGWRNKAIAWVGDSNSGKSVLSAHAAGRGIEVLSDDLVALDMVGGTPQVHPGYPWICLRPGSFPLLRRNSCDAKRYSNWYYLDEPYVTWNLRRRARPQLKPRKLEAIYLLAPLKDSRCEPTIEPIPPRQALIALMEAATRTHVPYPDFLPHEFSFLGSVVAAVPVYRLRYHLSGDSLAPLTSLLTQPFGLRSKPRKSFNHDAASNTAFR